MPFLIQGKTNWEYILIILVLALIVGGGIFYCYSTFKGKEWPPIIPPPKEINIFTDKTEYEYVNEPEGIIKLTVKNNLDKSICFESCNTYYLLKRRDSDWEEVDKKLCESNLIKECIQPSETKTFEYIRTWKEEGIYKFVVPIFFEEEIKNFSSKYNEIVKIIYSNEFKIKTKEVAGETANWKTYRNEEYGFEIKYPEDFEEKETTQFLVLIRKNTNPTIRKWFIDNSLIIAVKRNENPLNKCPRFINAIRGGIEETKIIFFDDIKFERFFTEDAAAGNHYITIDYTTGKGNLCFDFYFSIIYRTPDTPDLELANQEISREIELCDQILSTFRFLPSK